MVREQSMEKHEVVVEVGPCTPCSEQTMALSASWSTSSIQSWYTCSGVRSWMVVMGVTGTFSVRFTIL